MEKRAERKDYIFDEDKVSPDQELDIMMYNNGVYPLFPPLSTECF